MKSLFLISFYLTGAIALAQHPIDREETVLIGGIRQYITIQGKDSSLPLLLFLHGGPGGSVMNYAGNFTDKLQKHFVVIQWDQRETGRTRQLNASTVPLTYAVFQQDTHALIQMLLKRFHREKLYLAGHSWGTALGFHIARDYPALLYAYMPIGPMINQRESERIALGIMKEKALKTGNQTEMEELATVRIPFETGKQLYYHRKWLLDFAGSKRNLSQRYVEDWSATWLKVFNEASGDNLIESLPAIGCPVYFFVGRKDYQTNSKITETYYTALQAPKKALFWFELSGHSIPSSEPDRLQDLIIEKILPQTFIIQKAAQPVISDH
ncbi:MAG: alpha/beta hydrolase [Chryseosolibacter sp.]